MKGHVLSPCEMLLTYQTQENSETQNIFSIILMLVCVSTGLFIDKWTVGACQSIKKGRQHRHSQKKLNCQNIDSHVVTPKLVKSGDFRDIPSDVRSHQRKMSSLAAVVVQVAMQSRSEKRIGHSERVVIRHSAPVRSTSQESSI